MMSVCVRVCARGRVRVHLYMYLLKLYKQLPHADGASSKPCYI